MELVFLVVWTGVILGLNMSPRVWYMSEWNGDTRLGMQFFGWPCEMLHRKVENELSFDSLTPKPLTFGPLGIAWDQEKGEYVNVYRQLLINILIWISIPLIVIWVLRAMRARSHSIARNLKKR